MRTTHILGKTQYVLIKTINFPVFCLTIGTFRELILQQTPRRNRPRNSLMYLLWTYLYSRYVLNNHKIIKNFCFYDVTFFCIKTQHKFSEVYNKLVSLPVNVFQYLYFISFVYLAHCMQFSANNHTKYRVLMAGSLFWFKKSKQNKKWCNGWNLRNKHKQLSCLCHHRLLAGTQAGISFYTLCLELVYESHMLWPGGLFSSNILSSIARLFLSRSLIYECSTVWISTLNLFFGFVYCVYLDAALWDNFCNLYI